MLNALDAMLRTLLYKFGRLVAVRGCCKLWYNRELFKSQTTQWQAGNTDLSCDPVRVLGRAGRHDAEGARRRLVGTVPIVSAVVCLLHIRTVTFFQLVTIRCTKVTYLQSYW